MTSEATRETASERPVPGSSAGPDDWSAAFPRVADMVYNAYSSPDWADGLPEYPNNISADGLREATPDGRLPEPTSKQHQPELTPRILGASIPPPGKHKNSGPIPPEPDAPPIPPAPPVPEPDEQNFPQPPSTAPGAIASVQTSVGGGSIQAIATRTTGGQTDDAQDPSEQENLPYVCNTCGKSHATRMALNGHKNAHSKKARVPSKQGTFACNKCDKTYHSGRQLSGHMGSHDQVSCQYCSMMYLKRAISRHQRACHLNPQNKASKSRKKKRCKKQNSKEESFDGSASTERG
ncbi:hypothetical protein BJX62DRAFT_240616 [Aspergillus germanicus]